MARANFLASFLLILLEDEQQSDRARRSFWLCWRVTNGSLPLLIYSYKPISTRRGPAATASCIDPSYSCIIVYLESCSHRSFHKIRHTKIRETGPTAFLLSLISLSLWLNKDTHYFQILSTSVCLCRCNLIVQPTRIDFTDG